MNQGMYIFPERKIIRCNYIISDEEWRCIEVFRRRATDFIEERNRLNLGRFGIHLSREPDGNLSGRAALPPERELKHLYLSFRFFYHKDEPSSFGKVANIVSRAISDPLVREAIKRIKAQWKGSFSDTLSQFHGRKYSSEEIIDSWFNAHIFHSDYNKEQKLKELKSLLKDDLSHIALFMAIWDAGLAVSNLFTAVERMGRTDGEIALPRFMSRK
jgi:hypothetical protein